jgi:deoxyribodipyrimidine photo-lyase
MASYPDDRDRPDVEGTSALSPHLHFGEISPRQIWHEVRACARSTRRSGVIEGADAFLRQLVWREFAYHILYHFPETPEQPLRAKFAAFPWRDDPDALRAWQRGRTGYPLVDAGMRQLWATGWMHNRVRMVVASFLVKHLLLPWQAGARWFWDTLVDADLANNTLGWQWVAGCGADAAPYFRIFNPVTQGKRYDPDGTYVRQWIPELSRLPTKWIHEPWAAPEKVLSESRADLRGTYPEPIVEHTFARQRALAALASIKNVPSRPVVKRFRRPKT